MVITIKPLRATIFREMRETKKKAVKKFFPELVILSQFFRYFFAVRQYYSTGFASTQFYDPMNEANKLRKQKFYALLLLFYSISTYDDFFFKGTHVSHPCKKAHIFQHSFPFNYKVF